MSIIKQGPKNKDIWNIFWINDIFIWTLEFTKINVPRVENIAKYNKLVNNVLIPIFLIFKNLKKI